MLTGDENIVVFLNKWQACRSAINCASCLHGTGVPCEAAMRLVNHSSELIQQSTGGKKVEDGPRWRHVVRLKPYACYQIPSIGPPVIA